MEELYTQAIMLARQNNQVVGEHNDYYITLQQLEILLKAARYVDQAKDHS